MKLNLPNCYEITAEQRTPEWFKARSTRFTASNAKVYAKVLKRGGTSVETLRAIDSIAFARARKDQEDYFLTLAELEEPRNPMLVDRGIVGESYAFRFYKEAYLPQGYTLAQCGLLVMKDYDYIAGSPDGLIFDNNGNLEGLIEIKTLSAENHKALADFRDPKYINEDYILQMEHQLLVTGAKYCHFVAFRPECNVDNMLVVLTIKADPERQKIYLERLETLNKEVEEKVAKIRQLPQTTSYEEALKLSGIGHAAYTEIAKKVKVDYILYSGFGQQIVDRSDLPDYAELLQTVPTLYEQKHKTKEIVAEYLEDNPHYKIHATRGLEWKAKRWYYGKLMREATAEEQENSKKEFEDQYEQLLGGAF
ncbi:hypothetical protein CKF54_00355 [Psittacicella hinzii]|uniref:YqaJ viral recombinase domain-containing protein n=1 Tax=Psittacicella hinzii TaxID=2028575 RepID=A0A3A1YAB8_9GAMM|nr:lambda exonuclease family protein [Psittacicella hinzii]RIY34481.1 hypothetical protein CKF54_00355 [Psittacicella hinzii]